MYPIRVQAVRPEQRNRATVAVRLFMLIPHMVVAYVWNIAAELASIGQWFVCVFTGKRHEGLFNFTRNYLGYTTRVGAYALLLHDDFPAFGPMDSKSTLAFANDYDPSANRLTSLFRFILQIPALIVVMLYGIAAFFVVIAAWFSIVITGKMSEGMWNFLHKVLRLGTAVNGYGSYLTTDVYPWPGAVG